MAATAAELKTLGRCNLEPTLGKGAMGVVYEGLDPRLGRRVAIKTILKSHLDEDTARDYSMRFVREAQAVARLNHPNIVQVYDFGEEGDIAYLVMEFIKGKELKTFFDANERFDLKEAVRVMCELCDALDFAHNAGIIHRDIKPANVMLDAQARTKLTDFGVARVQDSDKTSVERRRALQGKSADDDSDRTVVGGLAAINVSALRVAPAVATAPAHDSARTSNSNTQNSNQEVELEFWRAIKDGNDPDDFELYVQQFPNGIYAALAKRKIAKLRGVPLEESSAKAKEQERKELEEAARREAEAKAKLEAEKARLEAEMARKEAEYKRREAEAEAKRQEAAELAKREAEKARQEAAELARKEAEKAKQEASAELARREAEVKKREAEAEAKRQAEAKARAEA